MFWNAAPAPARFCGFNAPKDLAFGEHPIPGQVGGARDRDGLLAPELNPRHPRSILSNTNLGASTLAVLSAHGVANGIYPPTPPSRCIYLADSASWDLLFVENDEQASTRRGARSIAAAAQIIVFDMACVPNFTIRRS